MLCGGGHEGDRTDAAHRRGGGEAACGTREDVIVAVGAWVASLFAQMRGSAQRPRSSRSDEAALRLARQGWRLEKVRTSQSVRRGRPASIGSAAAAVVL